MRFLIVFLMSAYGFGGPALADPAPSNEAPRQIAGLAAGQDPAAEREECKQRAASGTVKRVALVVGNNTVLYRADGKLFQRRLANGINDAKLIADTLQHIGFEVESATELDKADLLMRLDQFGTRIAELCKDDIALFYYAGNGGEVGRISYIGAVDAEIPTDPATELQTFEGWVNSREIFERLKRHEGPKIVILDTCRTDPLAKKRSPPPELMGNVKIPPNTLIAYAAEPGQEASDGPKGAKNGPYAVALATGLLEEPGSVEQLFRFVRDEVEKVTKGKQIPFIEASLTREVFVAEEAKPVPTGQTRGLGDPVDRGLERNDGGPKRVALVIGNSHYSNQQALKNPENDARAVAASLRRLGFEPVIELYDQGKVALNDTLRDFGDRADTADWALIYFAGHGIQIDGEPYILPTDIRLKSDADIAFEGVSVTQVLSRFERTRKLGIFIVDACRNNPWRDTMERKLGTSRGSVVGEGLPPIEPPQENIFVAYSTKHGKTASDGSGSNSPYVEALIERIEQPGLEVDMMFRMVRDAVRKKTDRKQQPFVYGSLPAEPMYFKPPSSEVKATGSATTTSAP